MCGICGELRLDGSTPDLSVLDKMMPFLARRGPDHAGTYADGPVVLGHRRLAIIDLSAQANQPMIDSELGLTLVFNGTIYNYPELREELQGMGYHFFSHGDSEVILKAYAAWGKVCVKRLHGMFAFTIWDAKQQCLFMARDRFGIKPFYYTKTNRFIRFASNSQALLATPDVNVAIDQVALHHHFSLHAVVPAPRTLMQGIRKLEPGYHLTVYADGREENECYWRLKAQRPDKSISELDWIELIRESLLTAVKRRTTIADVPVGVLLSGGIDSSLLVALLAEAGVEDIRTFSVGFDGTPEELGDEFEYSDQVVDYYHTRHCKYHIPNSEVLKRLPEAVRQMAEPMVGQDAVAFYLLAEQVSSEVKVVQSGQGADEVFGGYFWYQRMHESTGTPLERFRQHYFDRDHEEYLQMIHPDLQGEDYTAQLVSERLGLPDADEFIDQVLRFDVTNLIVDDPVKRVDNMTMAWGLEARVPFLDQELVELVASMPACYKFKSGGKHILKSIARGILPDAVIDRPKAYFPVPALKYVRGEFYDFMQDILNSRACRERGIYQRPYVDKMLADPEAHMTRIQGSKLWHLALLEYWLQENVDVSR